MATSFMIHPNRPKEAFEAIIGKWVGLRRASQAYLIRKAEEITGRLPPELARFGKWARSELQRLCHMAELQTALGQCQPFYARFIRLITLNCNQKDAAAQLACLWLFLEKESVSPTPTITQLTFNTINR